MKDILPKITTQFESLKPSFTKIDRMEELIARINADFDVIEKQLEDAENTIVEGTLKNVLKMPLNLFNKQLSVTEVKISKKFCYSFFSVSHFRHHHRLLGRVLTNRHFLHIPYLRRRIISQIKHFNLYYCINSFKILIRFNLGCPAPGGLSQCARVSPSSDSL